MEGANRKSIKIQDMSKINITAPISVCERTGLPRVARFTDLSIHANGSVHVNYTEDTLDNNGEVFLPGTDIKTISHNPWPVNTPDGPVEQEITPELQAVITAVSPKLTKVLKAIEPVEEGGGNGEG